MTDYRIVVASDDSDRDGLGVEVLGPDGNVLAEIFRDSGTGVQTFTTSRAVSLPLDVMNALFERARTTLW